MSWLAVEDFDQMFKESTGKEDIGTFEEKRD